MVKLVNRAKMTTATTGTGTITLGSAVAGFQTFAAAGVANTNVVRYTIEDGTNWEVGSGTYTAVGTTLSRIPSQSSNGGAAITLSGNATVFVTAAAVDLQELVTFAETFALPTVDGTSGQVLTTNGSGTLTFTTVGGGGGSLLGDTDSAAPFETSLGFEAGANTTGVNNTFIGYQAGKANDTGSGNVAIGAGAMDAVPNADGTVAIGAGAFGLATDAGFGVPSVAIGQDALATGTATGGGNVAIGYNALGLAPDTFFTTIQNVAIGTNTMRMGGAQSVVVGYEAAYNSTEDTLQNTVVGFNAGHENFMGMNNTLLGYRAGYSISTGGNNTHVGHNAGQNTTGGTNQIIIGYGANASTATVSNQITLGNASITTLRCQVTTITSLSDARDKTDIQPLDAGLEFVEALNPVSFTWNMRDGGKVGVADTGFIAQELQSAQADTGVAIPGLVYDDNPDKLEAGYGKLIPVLVQAIKELSEKVKLLESELNLKC